MQSLIAVILEDAKSNYTTTAMAMLQMQTHSGMATLYHVGHVGQIVLLGSGQSQVGSGIMSVTIGCVGHVEMLLLCLCMARLCHMQGKHRYASHVWPLGGYDTHAERDSITSVLDG